MQKNIYLLKKFVENEDITSEALCVIAALRSMMQKDITEYFLSYNMISYYLFGRKPKRREFESVKAGFDILLKNSIIKIKEEYSRTDFICDLTKLYYVHNPNEYYVNIMNHELITIMNISGIDSYNLFKYYVSLLGTFNNSKKIKSEYRGKFGGFALDTLAEISSVTKKTAILYNSALEQSKLLFIVRHKNFNQMSEEELRELPNTYCRYEDKDLVYDFLSSVNKKYDCNEKEYVSNVKKANTKRGLAQKYRAFCNGKEYDKATIMQMYKYCLDWNKQQIIFYNEEKSRGYSPPEPLSKDLSVFEGYIKEDDIDGGGEKK